LCALPYCIGKLAACQSACWSAADVKRGGKDG
jgi:hypothetical protein